jgi:hypothetical protein
VGSRFPTPPRAFRHLSSVTQVRCYVARANAC